MNRRFFGALGVVAVFTLTVGSCKSDPLSDVHGTPAAVVTNFTYLQLPIGGTANVQASIVDATATPLEIPITFTACTADVSVGTDTSYHPIPATSARAIVKALTPAPSCVVISGGGVKDSVQVAVLPQAFSGTVSSATPKGGDTITINSTTLLKFDTATVTVTFGAGGAGVIVSKTPDVLKVLVPFGAAGPLTIAGIKVTYVSGLIVTLPSSATVTQTGDFWAPGDTGYASAPALVLPTTTNQRTQFLMPVPSVVNDANCGEGTASGATGKCTIFKYTANGTDSLKFTTNWTPATTAADASDIDTYSCGAAGVSTCFEDGGAGATAKTPEAFTFKPTAGVHYFVLEQFSTGEDPNIVVTITKLN
jgi:hypothetical protein